MRKTRMATHSTTAFDESEEVRILSGVLESKRKIKTFFKENDRTPNHDGNFEITNDDQTPKKQFIVQIKKIENLVPKKSGKNKGKYVYNLDTAFLYYVKEKVTESPAIYFVVDIVTKNIFWIYLSDEKLMALDFENAGETLPYAFSESDKLVDIDDFTNTLNSIAEERNSIFVEKTPEEIAEMQDAVEYLNNYMNNDFIKIKEAMFPNLWRFGLRHSHTSGFSMTIGEKTVTPENTALFALYPQVKGGKDTGIQNFRWQTEDGFNNTFDLIGTKKPIEYSKESLEKIIKDFFEHEHTLYYLPTIAIREKLYIFANELNHIFDVTDGNGRFVVKKVYIGLFWLLKYIELVLIHPRNEQEGAMKQAIERSVRTKGKHSCNFVSWCFNYSCNSHFADFCRENDTEKLPRFPIALLDLLKADHIRAYLMAMELEKRGLDFLDPVWTYDYYALTELPSEQFTEAMDNICEEWLSQLPELYNETFDKLFDKNKYRFTGKFEYKNVDCREGLGGPWLSNVVHKYGAKTFSIVHNPSITDEHSNFDCCDGLTNIESGLVFERFLQRKTLFYDSINCLLYEGIGKELGIKGLSLSINGLGTSLFC